MSYYVYIIYSGRFDRYYVGHTEDFPTRLENHNKGFNKSTCPYAPWILKSLIEKNSRGEAMNLEKKLKNLHIEKLWKFIAKYT
jgi:putative endonuclease